MATLTINKNKTVTKVLVGLRLRYLRKKQGLSQAELAHECKMDKSYLASIEQGRRNVGIVNIAKICHALKITISEFAKFDEMA